MKKGILSLLTWCLPFVLMAQTYTLHGINWTKGLSLELVKQKAIQENKYIFLDCFTTWCGPCKLMDKQVYVNDTVADFFNKNFLSVKVQMDRTKSDDDFVKSWYSDVDSLNAKYKIEGYPTFMFFSPTGNVVDIELGFKKAGDFLSVAKKATESGTAYMSPYAQYDSLVKQYNAGMKNYDQIPSMVLIALKFKQNEFALKLVKDHLDYALKLPKEKRYTKQNIEMWNSFTLSSKTNVFQFFYRDGEMIDKVMGKKGFSQGVVDKTIQQEIIKPFFAEQNKNSSIKMSGMVLTDMTGKSKLQSDSSEANWEKLYIAIKDQYNSNVAKRNVLSAKAEWYKRHRNFAKYVDCELTYLNKYCSIKDMNPFIINDPAFDAFKYSIDKKVIDGYIKLMKKVVEHNFPNNYLMDTYANLLYKAGRTSEAISWEQKTIDISSTERVEYYKTIIEQMRKGEKINEAIVWGYR